MLLKGTLISIGVKETCRLVKWKGSAFRKCLKKIHTCFCVLLNKTNFFTKRKYTTMELQRADGPRPSPLSGGRINVSFQSFLGQTELDSGNPAFSCKRTKRKICDLILNILDSKVFYNLYQKTWKKQ